MMINIIEDNKDFLICIKPIGIQSQNESATDMVKLLAKETGSQIYPVHRLDTAVGGVMVFAKNSKTASDLSKQIADKSFRKTYLAVINGIPENKRGTLVDLLFKDSRKNKSYVVNRERKGVKKASLEYEVIGTGEETSLVKVLLHTGRTHQIRVQFASRKMPLIGDGKYGSKDNRCGTALWSHKLEFKLKDKEYEFTSLPDTDEYPWRMYTIK